VPPKNKKPGYTIQHFYESVPTGEERSIQHKKESSEAVQMTVIRIY
jgi:hypothetical protein